MDAAREHYQQASQSDSQAGLSAQRELVLMDIASNPGQYVASSQTTDEQGHIYCLIGNLTNVSLTGISIQATFTDDGGQSRQANRTYSSILKGNARDKLSFGWSTANRTDLDRRVRCEVTQARVAQ